MNQIKSRKGYKIIKGLFGKYEEIPENWNIFNLTDSNILVLSSGKSIKSTLLKSKEQYPVYGANGVIGYTKQYNENDSILIGRVGTSGSIHNLVNYAWVTDNVLIAKMGKMLNKKFCFYTLKYLNLERFATKTSQPLLTQSILKTIKIKIPPLFEQQKIASILSNVDTLIENTQKIIDTTIKLKKGLMQKLFTQGIGHTKFRKVKSLFGKYEEIPEKWECKKLENITEIFKGRGLSKGKISFQGKYKCVLYGELFTTYSQIIENIISKTDHFEGVLSQIGDILMPSSTTTKGIDLATSSVLLIDDIQLGGDINIIRPKLHSIDSVFLGYYLSNKLEKKIASIAQGFTIIHLYPKHLQKLEIYIPKEKKEQQKIGSILSNIDSLIQLQRNNKEKLEHLKKSLMQKLLTGNVRVKI